MKPSSFPCPECVKVHGAMARRFSLLQQLSKNPRVKWQKHPWWHTNTHTHTHTQHKQRVEACWENIWIRSALPKRAPVANGNGRGRVIYTTHDRTCAAHTYTHIHTHTHTHTHTRSRPPQAFLPSLPSPPPSISPPPLIEAGHTKGAGKTGKPGGALSIVRKGRGPEIGTIWPRPAWASQEGNCLSRKLPEKKELRLTALSLPYWTAPGGFGIGRFSQILNVGIKMYYGTCRMAAKQSKHSTANFNLGSTQLERAREKSRQSLELIKTYIPWSIDKIYF